jgi:hypothetical protein
MKIKLKLFSISYILISLYILGILIPFNQNKILFKNSKEESKFSSYNKNLDYSNPWKKKKTDEDWDEDDWDDDDWRWDEREYQEEMKNLSEQIQNLKVQKQDQEQKIKNSIFYLVLLGILAFILLLVIIIYCSIKCYILCSSPKNTDYLISKISLNHLGEVYIGENGELRCKQSINPNSAVNCDAPISANNGNERQYNTFNPDNFISSEEDKKLYRPYDKEDIN